MQRESGVYVPQRNAAVIKQAEVELISSVRSGLEVLRVDMLLWPVSFVTLFYLSVSAVCSMGAACSKQKGASPLPPQA